MLAWKMLAATLLMTFNGADYFMAYQVPQPPQHLRGDWVAKNVVFAGQKTIDLHCGGRNKFVACAGVGEQWMVLPNPCQARFAGESYAAMVCHEKGHNLGWSKNHER